MKAEEKNYDSEMEEEREGGTISALYQIKRESERGNGESLTFQSVQQRV